MGTRRAVSSVHAMRGRSTWLMLAPCSDTVGVIGGGSSDALIELTASDMFPFEGLGGLDVRDAGRVPGVLDEIVEQRIDTPASLEGSEQACAVCEGSGCHATREVGMRLAQ